MDGQAGIGTANHYPDPVRVGKIKMMAA